MLSPASKNIVYRYPHKRLEFSENITEEETPMKKLLSVIAAFTMLLSAPVFTAFAEDTPTPADVDEAVYAQLMANKWICDKNSDGVITEEELQEVTQLSVDLDGITDLSWLSLLPSCHYITFKNGTITDFSALQQMPKLSSLEMDSVPLTDINFIKDLNLESCRFKNMDQITTAQRMEVLNWHAPDIWAGTAGTISCTPRGLTDYSVTIENSDIALFFNGENTAVNAYERVYGRSAGTTAYTVSLDGQTYYTGELTVRKAPDAFDPGLHNTMIEHFEAGQSTYYNPNNGNSGLVTLVNGTLYTVRGSEIKAVETDVADYEHVYKRSYSKSYNYADMVLKTDGTLLVNGEPITDIKVKAMRKGFFLGENGSIYSIVPDGDAFSVAAVTTDSKGWVDGCEPFYVTKDGHLKYYVTQLIGEGKLRVYTGNTNIGEPVSACSLGSVCYVVDGGRWLYEVSYSDTLSKKKIAEDVVSVKVAANGCQAEYTKKDGTVELIDPSGAASGYADRARRFLGVESGTFYIHEYQKRGVREDDAVISYYIDQNRTLSLSFLGDYCGLTHAAGEIGASYDTAQDQGYLYFLRTDGSIWKYNLDTKQWQEAVAGTVPAAEPQTIRGDVNADGRFDVSDVVALQKWLLAMADVQLSDWNAGDFCADGLLDIFDLCMMKRELVGTEKG